MSGKCHFEDCNGYRCDGSTDKDKLYCETHKNSYIIDEFVTVMKKNPKLVNEIAKAGKSDDNCQLNSAVYKLARMVFPTKEKDNDTMCNIIVTGLLYFGQS